MKKTAILSDAHGNLPALRAVIDDAYEAGAEEFWYLGDAVGYGPYPFQVWQELQELEIADAAWLAGNHEWGLLGKFNRAELKDVGTISSYNKVAWPILLLQREILASQKDMMEHLKSLPVMGSPRPGIYLGHGSFLEDELRSVIREVKTPALNRDDLAKLENRQWPVHHAQNAGGKPHFLALGHTHLPGIWRGNCEPEQNDINWQPQEHQNQKRTALQNLADNPILVNPGSVGISRNGDGCALYALVDWESSWVEIRRICYLQEDMRREMEKTSEYRALLNEGLLFGCRCS